MRVNFDNIPGYIKKEISSPKKVVRQGSKGHFPLRIQEWLHYHDFSTAIDSDYGPATVSQVKAFQDA
jgi:peptidoglycan hydrolase-like protein with peptidoglycan-binding domain